MYLKQKKYETTNLNLKIDEKNKKSTIMKSMDKALFIFQNL